MSQLWMHHTPVTSISCVAPETMPATSVQPRTFRSGTDFKHLLYTNTPARARFADSVVQAVLGQCACCSKQMRFCDR